MICCYYSPSYAALRWNDWGFLFACGWLGFCFTERKEPFFKLFTKNGSRQASFSLKIIAYCHRCCLLFTINAVIIIILGIAQHATRRGFLTPLSHCEPYSEEEEKHINALRSTWALLLASELLLCWIAKDENTAQNIQHKINQHNAKTPLFHSLE